MIYLDNSSTTRQADEVTELICEVGKNDFGNPSSLHDIGFSAEKRVSAARKYVAASLGAKPEEIVFNSGGTESDNTAIFGIARSKKHAGRKIITTKVEHPAVLEACRALEREGYGVVYLDVDKECRPDIEQLKAELTDDVILVSVMAVNNEVGTIMPLKEIAALAHSKKAVFHTDAVQAYGKMYMGNCGADLISMSSHKIHGPMGVGALYIRKGLNLPAFVVGGGQERNLRSGTENVPGIAGFGEAVRLAQEGLKTHYGVMRDCRDRLLINIRDSISDILVNSPEDALPAVLNISFPGTRSEVLLHKLEEDGIFVSTGSACSSNKNGGSHVLKAMGLSDKEIDGALRFSFSRYNSPEDMDIVADKLKNAVEHLRSMTGYRGRKR